MGFAPRQGGQILGDTNGAQPPFDCRVAPSHHRASRAAPIGATRVTRVTLRAASSDVSVRYSRDTLSNLTC
jgi:hypothetical protein